MVQGGSIGATDRWINGAGWSIGATLRDINVQGMDRNMI